MLYPNIHCLIWSHLSPGTVPERPSNLMLEVAKIWGDIYLFLPVLSSWNFSPVLTHGFVSFFHIISWEIISTPLLCISATPTFNVPLELYNSRPRFLTFHAIKACLLNASVQKWLNCYWSYPLCSLSSKKIF